MSWLSSQREQCTGTTYQVTVAGDDMADGDDAEVLKATGPGDQHVVVVSPMHRRDIVFTTTSSILCFRVE